ARLVDNRFMGLLFRGGDCKPLRKSPTRSASPIAYASFGWTSRYAGGAKMRGLRKVNVDGTASSSSHRHDGVFGVCRWGAGSGAASMGSRDPTMGTLPSEP